MNPDYDINKFQLPRINGKPWNKVKNIFINRFFQQAST